MYLASVVDGSAAPGSRAGLSLIGASHQCRPAQWSAQAVAATWASNSCCNYFPSSERDVGDRNR